MSSRTTTTLAPRSPHVFHGWSGAAGTVAAGAVFGALRGRGSPSSQRPNSAAIVSMLGGWREPFESIAIRMIDSSSLSTSGLIEEGAIGTEPERRGGLPVAVA